MNQEAAAAVMAAGVAIDPLFPPDLALMTAFQERARPEHQAILAASFANP
jgi:hypothetical protein